MVEPSNDYTYDAIYRLIEASGREHIGQVVAAADRPGTTSSACNLPHPDDGQAMRRYREQYEYDAVGNFLQLIHHAHEWRLDIAVYAYDEPSLIEPAKPATA